MGEEIDLATAVSVEEEDGEVLKTGPAGQWDDDPGGRPDELCADHPAVPLGSRCVPDTIQSSALTTHIRIVEKGKMADHARQRGRPSRAKAASETYLTVRCTRTERDSWHRAAAAVGLPLAEVVRQHLDELAARHLRKRGRSR